MKIKMLI